VQIGISAVAVVKTECLALTVVVTLCQCCEMDVNPLPLLFKALLHWQKDRIFFSGHLNLRTTPETGLPSRGKKKSTIKLKKTE